MKRFVFLWILLLAALPLSASNLYLDLRTNYDRADFSFIRVQLIDQADERRSWHTLSASGRDFVRGERIAEFKNVDRGTYLLSIELLDGRMRPVHGRLWIYTMGEGNHASTLLIVRP